MKMKSYFENLDGLRAIAALVVFCYHFSIWLPFPNGAISKFSKIILSLDGSGGDAGVRFFFVLSGFLITYLMLVEQEQNKHFSVLQFYLRRVLRIWPLYFFTLIIGFILYPLIISLPGYQEVASPLLYMTFLANLDNINFGRPLTGILGVQWSVSVEEQFYLIWPLLFMFFYRKNYFLVVIVSLLIVSIVFNQQDGNPYYLLSCIQELSLGALAAWLSFFYRLQVDRFLNFFSKWRILLVYIIGAALVLFGFQIKKNFAGIFFLHSFLISLFFAFVIVEQNYSKQSFIKVGYWNWLTYWGKRSYGLYLLHMVAITFSLLIADSFITRAIMSIGMTLILCEMSFYLIEKPFLRIKERLYNKNLSKS